MATGHGIKKGFAYVVSFSSLLFSFPLLSFFLSSLPFLHLIAKKEYVWTHVRSWFRFPSPSSANAIHIQTGCLSLSLSPSLALLPPPLLSSLLFCSSHLSFHPLSHPPIDIRRPIITTTTDSRHPPATVVVTTPFFSPRRQCRPSYANASGRCKRGQKGEKGKKEEEARQKARIEHLQRERGKKPPARAIWWYYMLKTTRSIIDGKASGIIRE